MPRFSIFFSRFFRAVGALLVLALAVGTAVAGDLNPFPTERLTARTLPNGLRVQVLEDHALPIVSVVVTMRGGAGTTDARGAAHYLEHLVLQGSKRYPGALEPQHVLEAAGAVTDAVTARDMTRYQATADTSQVKLLVDVLTDVTLHPLLEDEAFARERYTLLSEIEREGDDPRTVLADLAYLNAYKTHPYRYRPSGTNVDILSLTAQDVRDFHDRWYVPNNMSLTLVGDITPARAFALAQDAFGAAKAAPLPAWPADEPDNTAAPAMQYAPENLPLTFQMLAFPAPAAAAPAAPATDVIMSLLVGGSGSLLPAQWAKDRLTVYDSGGEYVSSRGAGRLFLWALTTPEQAEAWGASTQRLLTELATTQLPTETVALAKGRLAGQILRENETYTDQAATLAFYDAVGAKAASVSPALLAVTPEQVRTAMPTRLLAVVTLGARPKEGR